LGRGRVEGELERAGAGIRRVRRKREEAVLERDGGRRRIVRWGCIKYKSKERNRVRGIAVRNGGSEEKERNIGITMNQGKKRGLRESAMGFQ